MRFYFLNDFFFRIWMVVSAYRDSKKTSGAKLSEAFSNAMLKVKEMFEESNQSKL